MKKIMLFALCLCWINMGRSQVSPYTGTALEDLTDGDYYIYNIETGTWIGDNYTNTTRYTSRAELGARGSDFYVSAITGGYQINPKLGHNHSLNASNLYMDTTSGLTKWVITPVEGSFNIFTITSGSYTLGADATGLLINNASSKNTWQFVSREERFLVDCRNASMDSPVDLSWAVYGGTFPVADERRNLWQGAWGSNNVKGDDLYHCNRIWEMWKIRGTEVFQQLNDLPNGYYGVCAQAFYSPTANSDVSSAHYDAYLDGSESTAGYVFAGSDKVPMQNIYSLATDQKIDNLNTMSLGNGKWMPDGTTQYSNHIFNGHGMTNEAKASVTNGQLTFGVRVEKGTGESWILFDNFHLYYYGAEGLEIPAQQADAVIAGVEYRQADRSHLCVSFTGSEDVSIEHGLVQRITVTDMDGKVVAKGKEATNYYDGRWNMTSLRITLNKTLPEGQYTLTIPANTLLLKELAYQLYGTKLQMPFTSTPSGNSDGDMIQPTEELKDNQTYADGIRIAWQYRRQKYIGPGSYGRVIRRSNGEYVMVYSTGGSNIGGTNYIRFQREPYANWTSPKITKSNNSYFTNKNAEIIELADGRLMYAWLYRTNFNNSKGPSKIMAAYSTDGGQTWKDEQVIYTATETCGLGVWEPAMVQLPSGELQIYFANEASAGGGNQNISMRRSFNGGRSWQPGTEIVAYRSGSRDGMPVPVYLKNGKGIAVAIEDPGFMGTFKPMIVHTDADDNWASGLVDGNSTTHRWSIFQNSADYLPSSVYCGQPYLIQLHSGETVYSAASGEERDPVNSDNHGRMVVYVGNSSAKNFIARSFPFPFTNDPNARAIWNSIMQYNDSTLLAVCTVEGEISKVGIWTSEGKILHPISCYQTDSNRKWNAVSDYLFMGAESQAEARVKSLWDTDSVYFQIQVDDKYITPSEDITESDGVEVFFSTIVPRSTTKSKQYRILVDVNGNVLTQHGSSTRWIADEMPVRASVISQDEGYSVELAVPWSSIGGIPTTNNLYCCYQLHNFDIVSGKTSFVHEVLSGSNIDKAATWMRMPIVSNPELEDGIIGIAPENTASYCVKPMKFIRDGHLFIELGGKRYSAEGIYIPNISR